MILLRRARDAGLAVLAEGDKLVIRGPRRAAPVARLLIEHKPAVMAATIRSAAVDETRGSDQAEYWVASFAQRAAKWGLGGRPRAEAERVAWAEAQNRWHLRHGERVPRHICASCGMPVGAAAALDLIDGSRVHLDDENACLIRYGERWRAAATWALMALGLRPPAGFEE
jgi:hypothetical protein